MVQSYSLCGPMCLNWQIRLNFLQPTQVHNPNSKSIGSAIFAQLTGTKHACDTRTDRQTELRLSRPR